MRTSKERARLIHRRTAEIKQERRIKRQRRLDAACMAACLFLVIGIGALMPGLMRNTVDSGIVHPSGTASLLGSHAALGYIIMGLLAFLLGVCVTVLLYRLRPERRKTEAGGCRRWRALNSLTTSFRSWCSFGAAAAAGIFALRRRSRDLLILLPRLCLLRPGNNILCAVSGHHRYLAASILCGGDLMAGCVAFLPVRTDFANGGDEVPLFAPCRSHRGGHCGGCFSRP